MSLKNKTKYKINETTGCWDWQLSIKLNGYGQMYIFKRGREATIVAHKFYYEEKYGKVPEGMELHHKCRNKSCVNPDHLEVITHTENIRKRLFKRRIVRTNKSTSQMNKGTL